MKTTVVILRDEAWRVECSHPLVTTYFTLYLEDETALSTHWEARGMRGGFVRRANEGFTNWKMAILS